MRDVIKNEKLAIGTDEFKTDTLVKIPAKYWAKLSRGLLKTEVIIKKWSGKNAKRKGLDLVEPNGKKAVLDMLANIREFFLYHEQPDTYIINI
ncbi:hypothetical protein C1645_832342 [Glomus cerebriforme]|uniref:Uncharacterized protein n=1 Tax=Glomus cerebriforme TaxID=658196 RepID=A0A397SNH3_9GLOM|nr:hypothetical protein C1645_832342 [Glomus cerebriforme]